VRGRCYEMFKSSLRSRHWAGHPSAVVVQQAALLFKKMPPYLRD
jgi:hypothetical protein